MQSVVSVLEGEEGRKPIMDSRERPIERIATIGVAVCEEVEFELRLEGGVRFKAPDSRNPAWRAAERRSCAWWGEEVKTCRI